MKLQKQLKFWFTVHFIVDVIFALALFIAPSAFLKSIGWIEVDPIASRLVAAALFGIGIESFLGRKSSLDSFKTMLTLKVIWSFTAVTGIGLSLIENAQQRPPAAFGLMLVFVVFHILWAYFLVKVRQEVNSQNSEVSGE
jgi:divalent metal cation (Fe/Co/Zn/Cd) transporter